MATTSLDTLQAKALDCNTYREGRMFYVSGRDRYQQCRRNNHYAPKALKGNQRVSSVPGQWGVVASRAGAAHAYDICFALEYVGAIPEHIGKILCLSDEHVVKNPAYTDALTTSGITLIFDDIEGGVFPEFAEKPLVESSLIGYIDTKISSGWHKIIWKGDVPQSYIDYADKTALGEAYGGEMRKIDDNFTSTNARFWSFKNKAELASALSYGRLFVLDLENFENDLRYGRSNRFDFPCAFCYEPDREKADLKVSEMLAPMAAVLRIWSDMLSENLVEINYSKLDLHEPEKIERLLETGRAFGIDHALSAYFDNGVPVEDILA